MEKENYQKRSNGAQMYSREVSSGPLTVVRQASRVGSPMVCGPAGRMDSAFFPDILEREHKTVKLPPKKSLPAKFPALPVKSEAGKSFVCRGITISTGPPVEGHVLQSAGETLADEDVVRNPQPPKTPRTSTFVHAAAPVFRPQVSSLDVTIRGVAVPLKMRPKPAGEEDMKIPPAPPPSPVLQPSPPPQPCPHCARQRTAPASRPRVQVSRQRTFRPMPYNWSKWCS